MTGDLELVAELVLRESGIRLEPVLYPALSASIRRALPNGDPAAFLRAAASPVESGPAIARLIDEVTIKETFFFRERRQLDSIPWWTLLQRAQAAGSPEIRVWCAACATGEEAYTLALLACEAFAPAAPPVTILATDISTAALAAARTGRYGARSVRTVAASLQAEYFERDGERLLVGNRLRGIVRFERHNIVGAPMPPPGETAFDLIVCRNVLIYFDGKTADRVVGRLRGALRPGGTLILGSADALCGTGRGRAVPAPAVPGTARAMPPRTPLPGRPARPAAAAADLPVAETRFLRAIEELEGGEPLSAAESLRYVLYLDPTFGLAAFALGRANEATGDTAAARRAYEQALRIIDTGDRRHGHLLEQFELVDVATACRTRLAALR